MIRQIEFIRNIIPAILIVLFGLSHSPWTDLRTAPRSGVHKKLKLYIQRFEVFGKIIRGKDFNIGEIDMDFGNTKFISSKAVGWCYINKLTKKPTMLVSAKWWKIASELEKELLVFHELGHCILRRGHTTQTTQLGVPVSIMYPSVMPDVFYKNYRHYYIFELFTSLNNKAARAFWEGPL